MIIKKIFYFFILLLSSLLMACAPVGDTDDDDGDDDDGVTSTTTGVINSNNPVEVQVIASAAYRSTLGLYEITRNSIESLLLDNGGKIPTSADCLNGGQVIQNSFSGLTTLASGDSLSLTYINCQTSFAGQLITQSGKVDLFAATVSNGLYNVDLTFMGYSITTASGQILSRVNGSVNLFIDSTTSSNTFKRYFLRSHPSAGNSISFELADGVTTTLNLSQNLFSISEDQLNSNYTINVTYIFSATTAVGMPLTYGSLVVDSSLVPLGSLNGSSSPLSASPTTGVLLIRDNANRQIQLDASVPSVSTVVNGVVGAFIGVDWAMF